VSETPEPPTDSRIQRIIEWLKEHQAQITAMERGKLEVNFAGWEQATIRVALTMHYEA
jgi:hypothetical protein